MEAIDAQSIIRAISFKLVIKVGELLEEALVGMNVAVHSNGSNRLGGGHFARNHQIGERTGGRARHADHTMNENFS